MATPASDLTASGFSRWSSVHHTKNSVLPFLTHFSQPSISFTKKKEFLPHLFSLFPFVSARFFCLFFFFFDVYAYTASLHFISRCFSNESVKLVGFLFLCLLSFFSTLTREERVGLYRNRDMIGSASLPSH